MFTQKISMACTKEQYEKYLEDELLKMGYQDRSVYSWDCQKYQYISNNYMGGNGGLGTIHRDNLEVYNRTYLGSFNAELFLALAAMTDKVEGNYGEYVIVLRSGRIYKMDEEDKLPPESTLIRKATKGEIMAKFGGKEIEIKDDSSLNNQIGGNHYKEMAIQPIEFITKNNIPYMEGNIIKYICRHRTKNKAEDIKKIIHYCKLILEIEYNEK